MINKLYPSQENFMAAVDRGIELVTTEMPAPDMEHQADLKALLAIFITATIEMDPNAVNAPDLEPKLTSVRMALLAAYHLGKQDAAKDK